MWIWNIQYFFIILYKLNNNIVFTTSQIENNRITELQRCETRKNRVDKLDEIITEITRVRDILDGKIPPEPLKTDYINSLLAIKIEK